MNKTVIKFKKLNENAVTPTFGTEYSAGADLYSAEEELVINPSETAFIGTGIAVAGAFSLVRFRSVPGKAREIASIFLSMTAGLACAAGYVAIGIVFTTLVSVVMLVFAFIPLKREREYELRITIPESLAFNKAFDDIFDEYTKSYRLTKTKTSNMGSLYKLTYIVDLKDPDLSQEMIDALRTRNGNLEIALNIAPEENEL
jgi:uncharacterized membrane protein YhiD involved in acid resistance